MDQNHYGLELMC